MPLRSQSATAGAQRAVPAVVVGGTLNALGVVRSLAAGKIPIYVLATTRQCAAGWSRHCRFVRIPALDGQALIEALVSLAVRLACRPVLILTGDECVDAVSACRQQLESLYHISLPSDQVVRTLADKTLFQALAEGAGFEVPRAVCVANAADLERIATLEPPLVIKAGDKALAVKGLVGRAVRSETLAEAEQICTEMLTHVPGLIVQEWIDGPDSELLFTLFACDREGNLLATFHGRKLLCDPPDIGTTAICRAAPEMAAELLAATEHFIALVPYRGLGSLEFKRDRKRNRLVIIEPTVGRTDWQSEIATLCGVNLPLRLYQAELGYVTPPLDRPAHTIGWRSSAGYRTELGPDIRTVDGFFRCSDPGPALYHYLYERGVMRLCRGLVRALTSRASPFSTRT
jgi:D-aspartate ligase